MLAPPSRPAVYGPVRTVVWQGSAGERRPNADQRPLCLAILRSSPSITAAYRTAVRPHPPRPTSPPTTTTTTPMPINVLYVLQSSDPVRPLPPRTARPCAFIPPALLPPHHLQERPRRMAQHPPRGIDQPDLALHVQLFHLHLAQQSLLDLLLHAHARQKGHALVVLHQLADRPNGGHFHR